jgi:hypothetical protein
MSDRRIPLTLEEIKAYIEEYNASLPPGKPKAIVTIEPTLTDQGMTPAVVVRQQIRLSLGLPPVPETKPTMPVEGHVCEFPLWAFSKQRSTITELHIPYDDGSFLTIDAPKGMPSPRFPGYLDVILFYGQRDLFLQDHTEISVYSIFQALGMDPRHNGNYVIFRRDMQRVFALALITDRFRNPLTGQRSHVDYFRVLRTMTLAKNRREISKFHFDEKFIASLRSGYLKRLDWEFCLWLDKRSEALARFLYGHLMKRIGEKSLYPRNLLGFLRDVGLGYVADLEPYRRNARLKETVFPALDLLKGHGIRSYELDDRGNILFFPTD